MFLEIRHCFFAGNEKISTPPKAPTEDFSPNATHVDMNMKLYDRNMRILLLWRRILYSNAYMLTQLGGGTQTQSNTTGSF